MGDVLWIFTLVDFLASDIHQAVGFDKQMTGGTSNVKQAKRIFIVDEHPLFRKGLAVVAELDATLAICGEAGNVAEALVEIGRLKPDLVLTGLCLPDGSGQELIEALTKCSPGTVALVVSNQDEMFYAEQVWRAGGRGYISKHEPAEKLVTAIRRVLAGGFHFGSKPCTRLLGGRSNIPQADTPIMQLSAREMEVLELIGQGRDSHDIAAQLGLSIKTVDAHRSSIKGKLRLKNGVELVCYAARWWQTQHDDLTDSIRSDSYGKSPQSLQLTKQ